MKNNFWRILFPPRCTFCRAVMKNDSRIFICDECADSVPRTKSPKCRLCAAELPGEFSMPVCASCRKMKNRSDGAFIPLKYRGAARSAVLRFKYRGKAAYAVTFAYLIVNELIASDDAPQIDAIAFVPQHRSSRRSRGYNPAELLASEVGKLLSVEVIDVLKRRKDSKKQSKLGAAERLKNARSSYYLKDGAKAGGSILLIDDILTTGATADACARLLKKCGADKVYLGVAARNEKKMSYERSDN